MNYDVVILGYGPVGRETANLLCARGKRVLVAQRSRPSDLSAGVGYTRCDVLDADSVKAAAACARQMVVAVGFPYDRKIWLHDWPIAMSNVIAAAASADTRVIFFDNLYMYGPRDEALVETMPAVDYGSKPRARAMITRMWQHASAQGRVRFAALRAPDFYGPGVRLSHIGDSGFGAVALGKPAMLIAPPDMLHDFAYVPDIAQNIGTLLDAPDSDFGQIWHTPCAPTTTPRHILELGAKAIGKPLKIRAVPLWAVPLVGLFMPFVGETAEMRFQWDRPYRVDSSKWRNRFGGMPTTFEVGAAATARSFLPVKTPSTDPFQAAVAR